mgnify:CR=1 FL=1
MAVERENLIRLRVATLHAGRSSRHARDRDTDLGLRAAGWLPRVKKSTKGEGHERRYFYGLAWAVCLAQPTLWLLWAVVPEGRQGDLVKLCTFLAVLVFIGWLSFWGKMPRTRRIVPGELAVSD